MPSKKKKFNARFPAGRIKKIMQVDEDIGKVAQPVPIIISRALEMFMDDILTQAGQITTDRNAKTLTPSHMKLCIQSDSRFDFLKDLVKPYADAAPVEHENGSAAGGSTNQCKENEHIKQEPGSSSRPRMAKNVNHSLKTISEPSRVKTEIKTEKPDVKPDITPSLSPSPVYSGKAPVNFQDKVHLHPSVITHTDIPCVTRQSVISPVSPQPFSAFPQSSTQEVHSDISLQQLGVVPQLNTCLPESNLQSSLTGASVHGIVISPTTPPPLVPIGQPFIRDASLEMESGRSSASANFYKDMSQVNVNYSDQSSQCLPHQSVIQETRGAFQADINGENPVFNSYQAPVSANLHTFIDEDYDT